MKKNKLPDYRRETMEIIQKNNISAVALVQKFGISISTAYNWINGKKSPTRNNFEKLKQINSGRINYSGGSSMSTSDLEYRLGKLEGSITEKLSQVFAQLRELKEKIEHKD